MQDFKAIRIKPNSKATMDIYGKGEDKIINHQSYRALTEAYLADPRPPEERNLVGLHAKLNRLIIIDVDAGGVSHKHDGRPFWDQFCKENAMPRTYTVKTKNGGYHFYYRIPAAAEPEHLAFPGELAPGIDVIYNRYVVAPPSQGYQIVDGDIFTITPVPPTLLMALENVKNSNPIVLQGVPTLTKIHQPFSPEQINDLRQRLAWFREHGELSYTEWRDGLFSIKSGAHHNPDLMKELAMSLTYNQSYKPGDEAKAISILDEASPNGSVGPGTIFSILKDAQSRSSSPVMSSPYTRFEVLSKAGIKYQTLADGTPKVEPSEANTSAILSVMFPKDNLYFDKRNAQVLYNDKPIAESDLLHTIVPIIQSEKGMGLQKFKKSFIQSGIEQLIFERAVDPHREMLEKTKWDGIPRVDKFFAKYFRCTDNDYHSMASRCFWLSMAGRGLNPGAKVDFMIILEGAEGINKSSIVKIIGGDYTFAPVRDDILNNENELRKMHQAVIVELPELVGLMGRDSKNVKAFLSSSTDMIRGLYERRAFDHPRGFVFVGTTNDKRYLGQDFGSRRFLPIEITSKKQVDSAGIKADREQLFAEAVHRVRNGEPWWNIDKDLLDPVIKRRRLIDPVSPAVTKFVKDRKIVSVPSIYRELVNQDLMTKGLSPAAMLRISTILMGLGWNEIDTAEGVQWENPTYVDPPSTTFPSFIGINDLI